MNKNLKVILVALVTICIVGTLAFSDINGSYAISKIDDLGKIDDNIVLEMKYPDYGTISVLTTPNLKDSVLFTAIASCIKTIWAGDDEYKTSDFSQEEVIEFVENLSIKQEDKIADFFNKIPKLNKKISFKCDKCGQEYNFEVEGITDFFG